MESFALYNNQLTDLPFEKGQIQALHLGSNKLKVLPPDIGQLNALQNLYLEGNPICELALQKIRSLLPNCAIAAD